MHIILWFLFNPFSSGINDTQQYRMPTNYQLKYENSSITWFVCNFPKEFSCCLTSTMHNPRVLVNVFPTIFIVISFNASQSFPFIHFVIDKTNFSINILTFCCFPKKERNSKCYCIEKLLNKHISLQQIKDIMILMLCYFLTPILYCWNQNWMHNE